MIRKGKKSSEKWLDMCGMLPNMVPGIVMVVGLILFWNSPYMPLSIYNTPVMVIVTYVVLFLPYTVQYVKASLGQIDDSLVQAGSIFSGNYMYIFRKIIFPSYYPGYSCRMGDDIYNLDKGVSSIASRTTSIGRNVSNIYFCSI